VKNEYPDAFGKNAVVASVNSILQIRSKENGYTYIDLAKKLTDNLGNLAEQYAEPDGLHLNTRGYDIWASLLRSPNLPR
jgi:lysophospholipase L1-like esterase